MANLQGANRAYIEQEIPHIATLMTDSVEAILNDSEVIVVGNKAAEFGDILNQSQPQQVVIDLVRITEQVDRLNSQYQGICW